MPSISRRHRQSLGRGTASARIDKIRHYHDHPGFIDPHADAVKAALEQLPSRMAARLVFTAHSIPTSMNDASGPGGARRYETQLRETAALVAAEAAPELPWDLVWQSRSGPPSVPWLEPDINDHLEALAQDGVTEVVVSPIGFISDHLEVIWDLDEEARATAAKLGLAYVRAATPGVDPRFVDMIRQLVDERVVAHSNVRHALGTVPTWDYCPADCCQSPIQK